MFYEKNSKKIFQRSTEFYFFQSAGFEGTQINIISCITKNHFVE